MLDSSNLPDEKASHQQCFACFRRIICTTTIQDFLRGLNINILKMMTTETGSNTVKDNCCRGKCIVRKGSADQTKLTHNCQAIGANFLPGLGTTFVSNWLGAGALLALANLQAATELVDAGVCVDVVVDGVGVALPVPLGGGGGGGGRLDRGNWLPHSHICSISKGLDCVTCGWKMMKTSAVGNVFREGEKEGRGFSF